ncbi:MAG: sigma-54 dependent transcriptional regulator [Nitrospiraceae bacterium]|nr:sigma-54 dependent transcriptional regulator [Nitrospiraceae bacterium]
MLKCLVVEDEKEVASLLSELLESVGARAYHAASGKDAVVLAEKYPLDLVLVDLMLPDMGGVELIHRLRSQYPGMVFIVITSVYDTETIVAAVKEGASEYITKPFEVSYLTKLLATYSELILLRKKAEAAGALPDSPLDTMIGESPVMLNLKKTIREIAPYQSTVLITGPTGVGKGMIAGLIHSHSNCAGGPFVVMDCTTIPPALLESELFGYVRGSFTGAVTDRKGLVEMADSGTLFVDEVGELPLSLQAKLLRFIDSGFYRRVGGVTERHVETRIIAATNRDLDAMVRQHEFREDLLYRLNVITLQVPPLRQRGNDIRALANYYVSEYSRQLGKPVSGFTKESEQLIMAYTWPGNVRELKNIIERAVILSEGQWINLKPFCLEPPSEAQGFSMPQHILSLSQLERKYIGHVLEQTGGNKTRAAELLGVTRKTLREKLKGQ